MTMSKRERVVQYFVAQARNCPDSQRDKFAEDRDRFDVFCGGIANSEQWIETYVERVEWGRLISRAYNEFLERRDLDQRCEGLDVGGEDGGEGFSVGDDVTLDGAHGLFNARIISIADGRGEDGGEDFVIEPVEQGDNVTPTYRLPTGEDETRCGCDVEPGHNGETIAPDRCRGLEEQFSL